MADAKPFAVWDIRGDVGGSALSICVDEPTDIAQLRLWHRTHLYETAAGAVAAGPAPAEAAHRLRDDYEMRRAAAVRRRLVSRRTLIDLAILWALFALGSAIMDAGAGVPIAEVVRALAASLLRLGLFGTIAYAVWWLLRGRHGDDPITRFKRRHCCDCGYDLTGFPPALPVDRYGFDAGPRRCPECDAPWPLVPPAPRLTGVYPGPRTP